LRSRNITSRPIPDEGHEADVAIPRPIVGAKDFIPEGGGGIGLVIKDEVACQGAGLWEDSDGFDVRIVGGRPESGVSAVLNFTMGYCSRT
jgi:hypothetical protein